MREKVIRKGVVAVGLTLGLGFISYNYQIKNNSPISKPIKLDQPRYPVQISQHHKNTENSDMRSLSDPNTNSNKSINADNNHPAHFWVHIT